MLHLGSCVASCRANVVTTRPRATFRSFDSIASHARAIVKRQSRLWSGQYAESRAQVHRSYSCGFWNHDIWKPSSTENPTNPLSEDLYNSKTFFEETFRLDFWGSQGKSDRILSGQWRKFSIQRGWLSHPKSAKKYLKKIEDQNAENTKVIQ